MESFFFAREVYTYGYLLSFSDAKGSRFCSSFDVFVSKSARRTGPVTVTCMFFFIDRFPSIKSCRLFSFTTQSYLELNLLNLTDHGLYQIPAEQNKLFETRRDERWQIGQKPWAEALSTLHSSVSTTSSLDPELHTTVFVSLTYRFLCLYQSRRNLVGNLKQETTGFCIFPMPQTPEDMFADKGYDGWDELSPRQKVERMLSIHKSGHEGKDVSLPFPFCFSIRAPESFFFLVVCQFALLHDFHGCEHYFLLSLWLFPDLQRFQCFRKNPIH